MKLPLNEEQIKEIIPHRPPFLFVREIRELEPGKRVVGLLPIAKDEWVLKGHFPSYPIVPGVIIVEALAQTGAVALLSMPEFKGKIPFFAGLEKVRFRKPVFPGDVVELEVKMEQMRGAIGKAQGTARVRGEVVTTALLTFVAGEAVGPKRD